MPKRLFPLETSRLPHKQSLQYGVLVHGKEWEIKHRSWEYFERYEFGAKERNFIQLIWYQLQQTWWYLSTWDHFMLSLTKSVIKVRVENERRGLRETWWDEDQPIKKVEKVGK